MEPEQTKSKWSVIELLAVTVPKTSGNHRIDIPGKGDHQVYTPSLQLPPPEIRSMEKIGRPFSFLNLVRLHVRDWGRGFYPRKDPSSWVEGQRI